MIVYQRTSEILRNLRGVGKQRLETPPLSTAYVLNGAIHLNLAGDASVVVVAVGYYVPENETRLRLDGHGLR